MNNGFMAQYWRVGGVCGLLFIILIVVSSIFQGEPPLFDDPVDEIRTYWVENGDDYLVGDYIGGLAFVLFFMPFVSALRSLLGSAEGNSQMWSRLVFAGGLSTLFLGAVTSIFWTTLSWGNVAETASDETLVTLMYLDVTATHFIPPAVALMTWPAAVVIFQTKVLPLWHGALTLLVAVVSLLSALAIMADNPDESFGWVTFPALGIWMLATSIVLILKKEAPGVAPVAATTAAAATASP
jgi:hypothetical protein